MMQLDCICTGNGIVTAPLVTRAVGAGNEQPVQHRQKYRSLNIELKLPFGKQLLENYRQTKALPEPLKNQGRTDSNDSRTD